MQEPWSCLDPFLDLPHVQWFKEFWEKRQDTLNLSISASLMFFSMAIFMALVQKYLGRIKTYSQESMREYSTASGKCCETLVQR